MTAPVRETVTSALRDVGDEIAIFKRCRAEPEYFFREVLGHDLWRTQVAIAESVRDHPKTAVPSCHSSGKTYVSADIVLWFLFCFAPSKVITTAPTERQVKDLLWSEIRASVRDAKLKLVNANAISTMRLTLDEDWFATGFTASDYDPNTAAGYHSPHILVVQDEAAGITPVLSEQISSLAAGGFARELQIGNPVETNTPFHKNCQSSETNTINISAYDTPNFTQFGLTEEDFWDEETQTQKHDWKEKVGDAKLPIPVLITPQWVAQRIAEGWHPGTNQYRTRIAGRFPTVSEGSYWGDLFDKLEKQDRITFVPHDPQKLVYCGWDLGYSDDMSIWFAQDHGTGFDFIDCYSGSGKALSWYVANVLKDESRKDYTYGRHYFPHDAKQHGAATGHSFEEVARDLGLSYTVVPDIGVQAGIDAVRNVLPRCRFDDRNTKEGREAAIAYQREKNKATGEFKKAPLHNWASHYADALRTMCVGHKIREKTKKPKIDTGWIT